ncbi:MAG: GTPase ObgE [Kiritimatiellaeota bacterium]|nr:GTPase ObgE [Kiritimatiellota bacterium]
MKTRTFVDQVSIHVRAGKGGDGCCSFRREACVPEGGPDGGDGGRGGHVIFKGCRNVNSLVALYFAPQVFAENGVPGKGQKMYGRRGKDLIVLLPCGTEVFLEATGQQRADIVDHDQEVVIAKGGKGGLGNVHFKTSTHQVPMEHTPGDPGEEFRLRLELKTIADAGLLGFPNAGKSSLLTKISDARPKIACYPFTTVNPIVGTIQYPDFSQLRVADIPGIIEGAADGIGLGLDFLRHISRSRVLVYVIDMAGTDNRNPWDDYRQLRKEVAQYDETLLARPSIILANKMDEPAAAENLPKFIRKTRTTPIPVSTVDDEHTGIGQFKQWLWGELKPSPQGVFAPTEGHTPLCAAVDENVCPPDGGIIPAEALARAPFLDITRKVKKKRD